MTNALQPVLDALREFANRFDSRMDMVDERLDRKDEVLAYLSGQISELKNQLDRVALTEERPAL